MKNSSGPTVHFFRCLRNFARTDRQLEVRKDQEDHEECEDRSKTHVACVRMGR